MVEDPNIHTTLPSHREDFATELFVRIQLKTLAKHVPIIQVHLNEVRLLVYMLLTISKRPTHGQDLGFRTVFYSSVNLVSILIR